jgi:hypothetical protein
MTSTPTSLGELFRSLDLTLSIRPLAGDDESWGCLLTRPDGATYEIDSVSFFDVDAESGEEWTVEPTPSRVLSVLAGGDVEAEEGEDAAAADENEAAVRAFLGDTAYDLLLELDDAE